MLRTTAARSKHIQCISFAKQFSTTHASRTSEVQHSPIQPPPKPSTIMATSSSKVTVLSGPTTPGTQDAHELASARSALTLLKTRLGKANLKTLLAPDIAAADTYWKSFNATSNPEDMPYAPISVTLRAQGISSAELLAWFKVSMSDIQTMWAGHPEHYINGHEVLETIDTHVSLFDLHFFADGQPPSFISKLLREEKKYAISMAAAGVLQADPRIVVGYACHQFRDLEGAELEEGGTEKGFEVRVGGCLPEGWRGG